MLRLPPFTPHFPTTVEAALALKAAHGAAAAYVAGGTDLYPNMKRRQQTPAHVIDLRGLAMLGELRVTAEGTLRIGAGVTLTRLIRSPLVRERWPVVARAAATVSTPILQNMGTVGGNLLLDTRCNYYDQSYEWRRAIDFCMKKDGAICWVAPSSPRCWAVQSSDLAPVMVALDARVELAGPEGGRTIPVRELYRNDGIRHLGKAPDELLVAVEIPPLEGARADYQKLRRRGSFDFPVLGVAAWARLEGEVVREARIVLGAVGSWPIASAEAAAALVGERLTEETIDAAARAAARPAKPLDNTDFTIGWRKDMVPVFVRRALEALRA
ncbi:MAG TPA: FAD binding domain-containing protein [Gemmatimonadales bacterium]|nr:FAD binding domain-containing protein [Gemmatimonadales bacterium]